MGTRNTKNIKIAVENCHFLRQNMRYVHFAEMRNECGSMRNMRQSRICMKLTCLVNSSHSLSATDHKTHRTI